MSDDEVSVALYISNINAEDSYDPEKIRKKAEELGYNIKSSNERFTDFYDNNVNFSIDDDWLWMLKELSASEPSKEDFQFLWDLSKKTRERFDLGDEYKNEINISIHRDGQEVQEDSLEEEVDEFAQRLLNNYEIGKSSGDKSIIFTIKPVPEKIF